MKKETFSIREKTATLYLAEAADSPLILFNSFEGDGAEILQALREINAPACHLLVVSGLDWDHDLAPWDCPALSKRDAPMTGGADDYLALLLTELLPQAQALLGGTPAFRGIAGYSLAGLFAIYALYQCDAFDRAASMSGSLWFPVFLSFACAHAMKKQPDKLYFSLGDREARTRHPLLSQVQAATETLVSHCRVLGIDTAWELNPGNHFADAAMRCAKGIKAILE